MAESISDKCRVTEHRGLAHSAFGRMNFALSWFSHMHPYDQSADIFRLYSQIWANSFYIIFFYMLIIFYKYITKNHIFILFFKTILNLNYYFESKDNI